MCISTKALVKINGILSGYLPQLQCKINICVVCFIYKVLSITNPVESYSLYPLLKVYQVKFQVNMKQSKVGIFSDIDLWVPWILSWLKNSAFVERAHRKILLFCSSASCCSQIICNCTTIFSLSSYPAAFSPSSLCLYLSFTLRFSPFSLPSLHFLHSTFSNAQYRMDTGEVSQSSPWIIYVDQAMYVWQCAKGKCTRGHSQGTGWILPAPHQAFSS